MAQKLRIQTSFQIIICAWISSFGKMKKVNYMRASLAIVAFYATLDVHMDVGRCLYGPVENS